MSRKSHIYLIQISDGVICICYLFVYLALCLSQLFASHHIMDPLVDLFPTTMDEYVSTSLVSLFGA
ncbi:hypothetical protein Hanom_Chr15g01366141 [Helianthus anomalus]